MKKLFLIISPYFIFCLLFSIPFIIRPNKHKNKYQKDIKSDTTVVDSTIVPDEFIPDDTEDNIPDDTEESVQQEFSIVVGSFKSHEKANNLKDKLSQLNFECNSQELSNGLIRITVGSGYSELELQDDIESLKKLGYEPWIIKLGTDQLASN